VMTQLDCFTLHIFSINFQWIVLIAANALPNVQAEYLEQRLSVKSYFKLLITAISN